MKLTPPSTVESDITYGGMMIWCAAYAVTVQVSGAIGLRSLLWALMLVPLFWSVIRHDARYAPPLDEVVRIALPVFAWCAWGGLSLVWSRRPAYSIAEWNTEALAGFLTFMAFLYATRDGRGLRTLAGLILAMSAGMAALAIKDEYFSGGFDPATLYHGIGGYSTLIVIVAPLALTLMLAPPEGFGSSIGSKIAFGLFILLILAAARLTDNRMVWPALAIELLVVTLGLHFANALNGQRRRFIAVVCACLAITVAAFYNVAQEKAMQQFPGMSSLTEAFAGDPRFSVWRVAGHWIAGDPWLGYGFGRSILGDEFAQALHDSRLTHTHNLFLSQWLQTGLVGVALFIAVLWVLLTRYLRFLRSGESALAVVGVVGLAVVIGFVAKNVTDDFLFRSNAREFWLVNGMLLGFGIRREASLRAGASLSPERRNRR